MCLYFVTYTVLAQNISQSQIENWVKIADTYYLDDENYSKAFEYYMKAANAGSPEGQYMVGKMFLDGDGVLQSYSSAITWLKKAAAQDDTEAMYLLGVAYHNIHLDNIAVEWYRKAAKSGNINGRNNLAICYIKGEGITQDVSEGMKWFVYDNPESLYIVGTLYLLGSEKVYGKIGVQQDVMKGLEYLRKAAEQDYVSAQTQLGLALAYGEELVGPSTANIQNVTEGVRWLHKAAEQGDDLAQFKMGCIYLLGSVEECGVFGVSQNITEGMKWIRKAAEQGDDFAQFSLGCIYLLGSVEFIGSPGVSKNVTEGKKWISKAAEQGNEAARILLEKY